MIPRTHSSVISTRAHGATIAISFFRSMEESEEMNYKPPGLHLTKKGKGKSGRARGYPSHEAFVIYFLLYCSQTSEEVKVVEKLGRGINEMIKLVTSPPAPLYWGTLKWVLVLTRTYSYLPNLPFIYIV